WASEVFSEHFLQCRGVQHRLRQQLLEFAVLFLESLQLAGVGDLHPAITRPPLVKRRIADAVLAAQIARRQPGSVLLQDLDDLLFREPAFTHRPSPRWRTEP